MQQQPGPVFETQKIILNHNRAYKKFDAHSFLFKQAEQDLLERLDVIRRPFGSILMIGARTSRRFIEKIHEKLEPKKIFHCDVNSLFLQEKNGVAYDAHEILPFEKEEFDLVISPLTLHTINDLPGFLIQIRRILKPDGLLLANLFGGETLYQLRQSLVETEIAQKNGASPRVAPFATTQQMGALMQRAGFALPVIDSDIIKVSYKSFNTLMKDLRGMGESLAVHKRNKKYAGKEFFKLVTQNYNENFKRPDGTLPAHFEIISLQGWAPHQSQPKALKPGSAQTRLADALKTTEVKAGAPHAEEQISDGE